MRSRFSPEDILQQVDLNDLRHIVAFEHRGAGAFIYGSFTILDRKTAATCRALHIKVRHMDPEVSFRSRPEGASYCSLLDQVYTDSGAPSRATRREEASVALMACLSDRTENHRQVIQLRLLEGAAVSEVAERLGRSEGAVVTLTKRALVALREFMDNMGDFTRGA
jgi:RNA polymerase sigma factor (sigma-70 family)